MISNDWLTENIEYFFKVHTPTYIYNYTNYKRNIYTIHQQKMKNYN